MIFVADVEAFQRIALMIDQVEQEHFPVGIVVAAVVERILQAAARGEPAEPHLSRAFGHLQGGFGGKPFLLPGAARCQRQERACRHRQAEADQPAAQTACR